MRRATWLVFTVFPTFFLCSCLLRRYTPESIRGLTLIWLAYLLGVCIGSRFKNQIAWIMFVTLLVVSTYCIARSNGFLIGIGIQ